MPLAYSRTLDPVVEGYSEGTYLVNLDIQPGRYRITNPDGRSSYFSRLDANRGVIDNDFSNGPVIVIVATTHWALSIKGTITPL